MEASVLTASGGWHRGLPAGEVSSNRTSVHDHPKRQIPGCPTLEAIRMMLGIGISRKSPKNRDWAKWENSGSFPAGYRGTTPP